MTTTTAAQQELFEALNVQGRVNLMARVFVTEQPAARSSDPETAKKAGALHPIKRGTDRALALLCHSRNPYGLTDFELASQMGRQQTSAGKRRLELMRAGWIEETSMTRTAPSGSAATVYRITAEGLAMARILQGA